MSFCDNSIEERDRTPDVALERHDGSRLSPPSSHKIMRATHHLRLAIRRGVTPCSVECARTGRIPAHRFRLSWRRCVRPTGGAVVRADIRGERVRVFSDECLLAGVQERFPDALPWLPVGLPEGYPFVAGIASHVGRLLCLQGTAAAAQVQRRACEKYGERETVSRAARRVLRTFVDWGVLAEGPERGVYVAGQTLAITHPYLTAWLVEAALYTEEIGRASVQALLQSSAFFPFRLDAYSPGILARADRIELVRHGLDDDMLILRQVTKPSSKRT